MPPLAVCEPSKNSDHRQQAAKPVCCSVQSIPPGAARRIGLKMDLCGGLVPCGVRSGQRISGGRRAVNELRNKFNEFRAANRLLTVILSAAKKLVSRPRS